MIPRFRRPCRISWRSRMPMARGAKSEFTGTGFPCVFYLKYHLYRNSFPLYAIARFRNQVAEIPEFRAMTFQPAEFRLRSGF